MFPNPTTGQVYIDEVVDGYFKIIDNMGRIIQEGPINESYDLTDKPAGIYVLLIHTNNGTIYRNVVKE